MNLLSHARWRAAALFCAATWGTTIAAAAPYELFVSPTGDDAHNGAAETPLASLHGAQRRLREIKKENPDATVQITLAAGDYYLSEPVAFTKQDSGSATAPVTIAAAPDATVRIIGGRRLEGFQPVQAAATRARLTPAALEQVQQCDLVAQGITNLGEFMPRGHEHELHPAGLELFYQGAPAQLARWPNRDWALAKRPTVANQQVQFGYEGPGPRAWAPTAEPWAHGFWESDWSDAWQVVETFAAPQQRLTIERSDEVDNVRDGARFYIANVLEELDQPGEWCVERASGKLYFWPPAKLKAGDVVVSQIEHPLSFYDVSHFTLRGVTVEAARACLVEIVRGEQVTIDTCVLRNAGNLAVNIFDGRQHRVTNCEIMNTGEGGLRVEGGNRQTLTAGEHRIDNNDIHHYARTCFAWRPAIGMHGVGVQVNNNLIHDGPDGAILIEGNDHVVERNDIHHVCLETADVGAIYLGHDWTECGNVIRHNYLHQLGRFNRRDVMGVYLDDFASGTQVIGNMFVDAGRAVVIGGGRDNVIANNLIVEGFAGVQVDSRGSTWASDRLASETTPLRTRLTAVPADLYAARYPLLGKLLENRPAVALGNTIERNVFVCPIAIDLHDNLTTKEVAQRSNWSGSDPKFVDRRGGDYRLQSDSPALAAGYSPFPWQALGRQTGTTGPQVVQTP